MKIEFTKEVAEGLIALFGKEKATKELEKTASLIIKESMKEFPDKKTT
jgi:hypothetical protein